MWTNSQTSFTCCSVWWWRWENSEAHLALPERGETFCREWGKAVGVELWTTMTDWEVKCELNSFVFSSADAWPASSNKPRAFWNTSHCKEDKQREEVVTSYVSFSYLVNESIDGVKAFHSWLSQNGYVLLGNISIAYCKEHISPSVDLVLNYSLYIAQALSKLHFPKDCFNLLWQHHYLVWFSSSK